MALCIPACDQGRLWAPEKSRALLRLGCHTSLLQSSVVARMESPEVKHLGEIAGTQGWKDLLGSASPFPCYHKSLGINLWLLLIKPSLSSGLSLLFHLQLWRTSLSPEWSKRMNFHGVSFLRFFILKWCCKMGHLFCPNSTSALWWHPRHLQNLAPGRGSNHFIVVAPRLLAPAFLLV